MNNKGVKTPAVLPWIPGGVDKKDSRNKYVHKKSEGRRIEAGSDSLWCSLGVPGTNTGVGRTPFSHYWPAGVIRIGLPV